MQDSGRAWSPNPILDHAAAVLLDWLGAALAGASSESAASTRRLEPLLGGPREASLVGCAQRASICLAALHNGTSSSVHGSMTCTATPRSIRRCGDPGGAGRCRGHAVRGTGTAGSALSPGTRSWLRWDGCSVPRTITSGTRPARLAAWEPPSARTASSGVYVQASFGAALGLATTQASSVWEGVEPGGRDGEALPRGPCGGRRHTGRLP